MRNHLYWYRFQRTPTDHALLSLRSCHTGTAEAKVPAYPTVQRPITVQSERTRTPAEEKYPTSQRTLSARSPTPFFLLPTSGAHRDHLVIGMTSLLASN